MRLRVGDHAQFKIDQTQTVRVRTQIPNEYSVSSGQRVVNHKTRLLLPVSGS